jgi:hypothetical protein
LASALKVAIWCAMSARSRAMSLTTSVSSLGLGSGCSLTLYKDTSGAADYLKALQDSLPRSRNPHHLRASANRLAKFRTCQHSQSDPAYRAFPPFLDKQVSDGEWIVRSQESSKHYVVHYKSDSLEGSCDCADYKYRRSDDGDYCKHIYVVVLAAS